MLCPDQFCSQAWSRGPKLMPPFDSIDSGECQSTCLGLVFHPLRQLYANCQGGGGATRARFFMGELLKLVFCSGMARQQLVFCSAKGKVHLGQVVAIASDPFASLAVSSPPKGAARSKRRQLWPRPLQPPSFGEHNCGQLGSGPYSRRPRSAGEELGSQ